MSENIEIQVIHGTKSNFQQASDGPITDPASGKVGSLFIRENISKFEVLFLKINPFSLMIVHIS